MKVEDRPGVAPERLAARRDVAEARRSQGAKGTADASSSDRATGAERVDLSPAARALPELVREVGDLDAIDAARVAELRQRIASGRYDPADEDVARALLRGILDEET